MQAVSGQDIYFVCLCDALVNGALNGKFFCDRKIYHLYLQNHMREICYKG